MSKKILSIIIIMMLFGVVSAGSINIIVKTKNQKPAFGISDDFIFQKPTISKEEICSKTDSIGIVKPKDISKKCVFSLLNKKTINISDSRLIKLNSDGIIRLKNE